MYTHLASLSVQTFASWSGEKRNFGFESSLELKFRVSGLLGGPFDLVSRVSKVGYGGL